MKIRLISTEVRTTFLFDNGDKKVKATKIEKRDITYWKIKGSKIRYESPVAARNAAGMYGS